MPGQEGVKMASVIVSVWLSILLIVPCGANEIPPQVVRASMKRSEALGDCTLVWQVSFSRLPAPISPQLRQQQYDVIYQQFVQRAAVTQPRDAEREAHQAAQRFIDAMNIASAARSYQTPYYITRLSGDLYVWGLDEIHTPEGLGFSACTVRYTDGYGIRFDPWAKLQGHTVTAQDVLSGRSRLLPAARVWAAPGHAANYRSFERPMDLTPEVLCLVAVRNPLSLYGASWSVDRTNGRIISLSAHVEKGNKSPFRVCLTLDKQRGMALSRVAVTYLGMKGGEEYVVSRWGQRAGIWIPLRVEEKQWDDDQRIQRLWQLKQVIPPQKNASVPLGFWVQDMRLLGPFGTDNDVATQADEIVGYKWNGRLPEISELQAMRHQTNGASHPAAHLPLMRFIAPLTLTLIGVIWYWRLKRAERKASSP